MGKLPLPAWYDERLIGNPFFQPNAMLIMQQAYEMAAAHNVGLVKDDKFPVLRIHVDEEPDFTWALTSVDPYTGIVTRFLHPVFKGRKGVEIPQWWDEGMNRLVWIDEKFNPGILPSIHGGRLSVAGAWNNTRFLTEWDLHNANIITTHLASVDSHPFTARFDKHFYTARANNPYGLPVGAHPHNFMDGPDAMFPTITPESLWHPKFNPDGWWTPAGYQERDYDEIWRYVKNSKVIYLWDMHCHRHTGGAIEDPVVMASMMHHTFLRGRLTAEPLWVVKGASWRTEFLGMHKSEFKIASDPLAVNSLNIVDLMDGMSDRGIPAYGAGVYTGQAGSHCVPKTIEQGLEQAAEQGRDDVMEKMIFVRQGSSNIIGFDEAADKKWDELQSKYGLKVVDTFDELDDLLDGMRAAA